MTQKDRYIAGVPCWADASFADPSAAADFYTGLFGWECQDTMPAEAPGRYFIGRLAGRDAAALSSAPEGPATTPAWNTYVWVEDADATVAAAKAAGGAIVSEAYDVPGAGRTASFSDPEGAQISIWQPGEHRGSAAVNEHGGVNFNDLYCRDLEQAASFYGSVFGWELVELSPGMFMWAVPAYGDFLEELTPGMRENLAEMGASAGFENVVASAVLIDQADSDTAAHWGVTFGVDDADVAAVTAEKLGGKVLSEPTDLPWVRSTTIEDSQGATFVASQFVPQKAPLRD